MFDITYYVLLALCVLITLSIHELSHGYAAYKLGDPTAKNLGRLTLNPIKHIDPIGALCMLFFRFGWAKPVPINMRYFKNPRRDFAITALAGPLSNLILAFISGFIYLLVYALCRDMIFAEKDFVFYLLQNTLNFFLILHSVNVGICIFNLIPVPPLDGSRLLTALLPPKIYFKIMRNERYIYIGFLVWLLLGSYVSYALLSVPFIAGNSVLSAIAKVFSLSDMISYLIGLVSDGILNLFRLIPFLR